MYCLSSASISMFMFTFTHIHSPICHLWNWCPLYFVKTNCILQVQGGLGGRYTDPNYCQHCTVKVCCTEADNKSYNMFAYLFLRFLLYLTKIILLLVTWNITWSIYFGLTFSLRIPWLLPYAPPISPPFPSWYKKIILSPVQRVQVEIPTYQPKFSQSTEAVIHLFIHT